MCIGGVETLDLGVFEVLSGTSGGSGLFASDSTSSSASSKDPSSDLKSFSFSSSGSSSS